MEKVNRSRRDFLKLMGMGTAAVALPGFKYFENFEYKAKIGLQLYSVRKEIEKDFEGTMKKVADIGYAGIETYFLPEKISLDYGAKIFKNAGLKVFSMHAELPVGKDKDAALKMADAYNCDRLVYHGWPEGGKFKTMDATKHTAEVYNESAAFLKSRGIHFGLHNHWWEFEKTGYGIYPAYYLLQNLDKEIFFEIDTYWAKTAGQDPAKVVHDFGKRAPLLHIKDGPAIMGKKSYEQVPAGEGVMDFKAIVKSGGSNIKWMIVEFDEYDGDIFKGISGSYEYLTKNGLVEGKT